MWNRKVIRASVGVASLMLISALSTGEAGAAPSKASYDLQVGAICRGYQAKLQAVGLTISSESTPQQLADELKMTIPMAQKGISKMSKIPQPKNDGRELKAVFSSQRNELKKFKQLAKAIGADKEATVHALLGTVSSVATKLKRQYGAAGLTECVAETSAAATP
jgi:hypothetical protein